MYIINYFLLFAFPTREVIICNIAKRDCDEFAQAWLQQKPDICKREYIDYAHGSSFIHLPSIDRFTFLVIKSGNNQV